MRPCKKLRYHGGKTVPVFLFDGTILTPVRELLRLFRVDRVPREAYATTPLFRRSSGASFTTDYVREVVRFLMRSVGLPPGMYEGHSLRIGGRPPRWRRTSRRPLSEPWVDGTRTFLSCLPAGFAFVRPPDELGYRLNFLRGLRGDV